MYISDGQDLIKEGFPVPEKKDIPTCDNAGMKGCSRASTLAVFTANVC